MSKFLKTIQMSVRHIGRIADSEREVSIVFSCFVKDIK